MIPNCVKVLVIIEWITRANGNTQTRLRIFCGLMTLGKLEPSVESWRGNRIKVEPPRQNWNWGTFCGQSRRSGGMSKSNNVRDKYRLFKHSNVQTLANTRIIAASSFRTNPRARYFDRGLLSLIAVQVENFMSFDPLWLIEVTLLLGASIYDVHSIFMTFPPSCAQNIYC